MSHPCKPCQHEQWGNVYKYMYDDPSSARYMPGKFLYEGHWQVVDMQMFAKYFGIKNEAIDSMDEKSPALANNWMCIDDALKLNNMSMNDKIQKLLYLSVFNVTRAGWMISCNCGEYDYFTETLLQSVFCGRNPYERLPISFSQTLL